MRKIRMLLLLCISLAVVGCEKSGKDKEPEKKKPVKIVIENHSKKEEEVEQPQIKKKNILIAIDPGHQSENIDMSEKEPNGPGSSEMKAKATSGTTGQYTGVPEYQLNMEVSLLLKEKLEAEGYDVILSRENNETAVSNAERAQKANDSGADVCIRIHANGCEDSSVSGALALVPSPENPYVSNLSESSTKLAEAVLTEYCNTTGMLNQGVQKNDTMTGMNWSTIPVMILEMGYMSNQQDDVNMADAAFREKMVSGIVSGINQYYGSSQQAAVSQELNAQIEAMLVSNIEAGEKWSVYARRMSDGLTASVGEEKLESASLIKLFIAATVYDHWDLIKGQESRAGETGDLLHRMISASDNEAANTLVKRLGQGDAQSGMNVVNTFTSEHGYSMTHMGRLMLDFDSENDNYTTAQECGLLLEGFYKGELAGSEAILNEMKQQERKTKIPAGVPEGIVVANKTGELDDAENDAAVVYVEGKDYIICIMSNNLAAVGNAQTKITELSKQIYQYMQQ